MAGIHGDNTHLLRVHGWRAQRIDDHHVGSSVCVNEVPAITLAQRMQDTGLVEVDEAGQVLHTVT